MERVQIEERVRAVLAEHLTVDVDQVTLDARLTEDLDADSLDLVEATMAIEEALGIEIPEQEMEGVKTVRQAVDLAASKLGVAA